MNTESNEDEELKKLAPNLFNHKKENPFLVPENYFESLPAIIQDKILMEKQEKWYEKILIILFKPRLAFGLLLFFSLITGGYFLVRNFQKPPLQSEMVFTPDDLKNADFLNAIDETTLIDELIAFNDMDENSKSNETEIDNYLIDNQTDFSQLVNEF